MAGRPRPGRRPSPRGHPRPAAPEDTANHPLPCPFRFAERRGPDLRRAPRRFPSAGRRRPVDWPLLARSPSETVVSLPEYLLDLPAEEAARLIALALLDRTAEAALRAGRPDRPDGPPRLPGRDAPAPKLSPGLPPGDRRQRVPAAPPPPGRARARHWRSRDAEVHLAWEREQEPAMSERQRAGLHWHLARMEARRRAGRPRGSPTDRGAGSPGMETRIRRRLERYRLRIERDPSRRRHEAAAVLGSRIRKFGGRPRVPARRGARPGGRRVGVIEPGSPRSGCATCSSPSGARWTVSSR